ncbi:MULTISPECIES: hypothetical protein [unclassified Meiothermus]|uniref:hypothetical protein n=1 Tax=unclassified Meiothermus TaxID=370471 RepID=UPI0013145984|nr:MULTISPECIES: hypothetical protein [unclassified Meiothermus]
MYGSNWLQLEVYSQSRSLALRREALQNHWELCLWRNRAAGWLSALAARLEG